MANNGNQRFDLVLSWLHAHIAVAANEQEVGIIRRIIKESYK
jgi:hypothetical protein